MTPEKKHEWMFNTMLAMKIIIVIEMMFAAFVLGYLNAAEMTVRSYVAKSQEMPDMEAIAQNITGDEISVGLITECGGLWGKYMGPNHIFICADAPDKYDVLMHEIGHYWYSHKLTRDLHDEWETYFIDFDCEKLAESLKQNSTETCYYYDPSEVFARDFADYRQNRTLMHKEFFVEE